MKIREIKKRALSALDSNPLSDKFIFFAFLVRCALSIVCILILLFGLILQGNSSLYSHTLLFCVYIIIKAFIVVLCLYSLEKKLLHNSNNSFDYAIKEFIYYIKDKINIISALKVYIVQNFLVVLWIMAVSLISKMMNNVFSNSLSGYRIIQAFCWIIFSIVTVIITIYIILSLSMATLIKIDDPNIKTFDCIKKSNDMMSGNVLKLFLLMISFIGWFLLCFLTFGIIYPFVLVYLHASIIEFYKYIKNCNEESPNELFLSSDTYIANDTNYNYEIVENNINEEHKKCEHRHIYLVLTIVLSLLVFVGMNYYANKNTIDYFLIMKKVLPSDIKFNIDFNLSDGIEIMIVRLRLLSANIRLY